MELKNHMMNAASCYIPKHNPSKPRGEDAHFIDKEAQVIGVADGVGGWAQEGIDAGKYSRKLMRNAAAIVNGCSSPTELDPLEVLGEAFLKTVALGSSTACIVSYDGTEGLLRAANLGDSGFMVVRGGKTLYKSPVQQLGFNHPYQMGCFTTGQLPNDAEEITLNGLTEGDVLIVGTDGLFDNLFLEDIESVVEVCLGNGNSPAEMAETLADAAREMSLDENSASPFELAAYEAGVEHFGGKYDDITVAVAYIEAFYQKKKKRRLM